MDNIPDGALMLNPDRISPWDLFEAMLQRIAGSGIPATRFEADIALAAARALESECYELLRRGSRCEDLERVAFWMVQMRSGESPVEWAKYLPQRCLDAAYGPGVVRQEGDWSEIAKRLGESCRSQRGGG